MFNPTLPERIVADALKRDAAAARAEWLAEWRDDIAAFLSRELVEAAVDAGVTVRPPVSGVSYDAFVDPSGRPQFTELPPSPPFGNGFLAWAPDGRRLLGLSRPSR